MVLASVLVILMVAMLLVIMVVVALFDSMIAVVMIPVVMVLRCVVHIAMCMRLEQNPFPERQFGCSFNLDQFDDRRVTRQCFDRPFQPRCQVGADPENQICLLQRAGL